MANGAIAAWCACRRLNQPGEIGKRPSKPIDLVDDDNVDAAGSDVGEQGLQRRPLHAAAREPAIVIAGPGRCPPLVLLAADVGLAGVALRRERVEFLFEPFLGGLRV